VVVKGRSKPVIIYELVAEKGNISSNELAYLSLFNEAVSLYKKREWDEAFKILLTLKEAKPDDKPTAIYLDRCVEFIRDPPPEDWTGTVIMKEK
jgi:adenylate cyclase